MLGNAATNIAFPLAMMCTGLGLLFGIGGAAAFNLHMGANKKEEAPYFVGNSIMMLMTTGVLLFLLTELFLTPLLIGFGSPAGPPVRACHRDRISIPDLNDWKRTSHSCRWQSKNGHVREYLWSRHQYRIGCRVCSYFQMGHVWSGGCNRDWADYFNYHCCLLSSTLPHRET